MHASTTGMETTRTVLLVVRLLCLTCLASGLSETKADQSGTFSVGDYSDWLENHSINLVNYVAEVGTDVAILSPISPPPIGMRWFSLNFDGELRRPVGREVGRVGSANSEKFLETYNTSWQSVFTFDKLNRWLIIRKVHLGYADLFRVFVGENGTEETAGRGSEEFQAFDVAITLMTFEKHECRFTSKPQNPKAGDTLILSCSVIVNGMWNASLIFRNDYDESEIIGETKTCGIQRSLGSKICSSVRVKAETDILAYSCRLKFSSKERHIPKSPMFLNSKWTTVFNKKVVCNLPKIYLEAIPSDVTLLCNNMPCGETVAVDDIVTCVAHGYPQPVFDLRIRDVSPETGNKSESQGVGYKNRFFMDTDEEESDDGFGGDYTKDATAVEIKGHEDFRIGPTNVGHIEITCNVSNALGWGYNSLVLEVKLIVDKDRDATGGRDKGTSTSKPFTDARVIRPSTSLRTREHEEGHAVEAALSDVEAAEADGKWPAYRFECFSDYNILCNDWPCLEDGVMKVGDLINIYFDMNKFTGSISWSANFPHDAANLYGNWSRRLRAEDVGRMLIILIVQDNIRKITMLRSIIVLPDFGPINILCNGTPCSEDEIMKVGDKISLYDQDQLFESNAFYWWVNLPFTTPPDTSATWNYTFGVTDVGRMTIEFKLCKTQSCEDAPTYFIARNIIVISDPLVGIDMLCNGKVCRDNEIMRFGDEISCYFEPKVLLDVMTFTLLIDNYTKVEGYPCTYAIREEDVGTKLVQCSSQGKAGPYQKTRNINITCAYRDEVVWKPAKKDYDDKPYELKFRKENVTYKSGAILLCGDEPCDKPGRIIYKGTYVICRLNDGKTTSLILTIDGRWINWQIPVYVSELSYKLTRTGKTLATCQQISHAFNTTTNISFIVHEWPCKAIVKPASADIFEYENAADENVIPGSMESSEHGDAAGAIDVDQAENTEPGPAASNKDAPKWNDGMAAEKSAGDDKTKPNIGSGRESFVLLQLFLAFIAAFVGLGQF